MKKIKVNSRHLHIKEKLRRKIEFFCTYNLDIAERQNCYFEHLV